MIQYEDVSAYRNNLSDDATAWGNLSNASHGIMAACTDIGVVYIAALGGSDVYHDLRIEEYVQ